MVLAPVTKRVKWVRPRRAALALALSVATLTGALALPAPAEGQIAQILQAVNSGGSWIQLPVEGGRASYRSPAFPLAGMAFDGCVKIWERHSGSWTITARDAMGDARLDVTTAPGEPVRFDYKAGFQAQLEVDIEWSEPRDTTLLVWVGVSASMTQDTGRDLCQPPPG